MTAEGIGIGALLFATDYPHLEGTFPFSRDVVHRMIAQHPDCSHEDFVAVLGGNAARSFKHANLGAKVAERAWKLEAA